MVECHDVLERVYNQAGLEECEVAEIEVENKTVHLCTTGGRAGCVYSININKKTGMNDFLGRIRPDFTLDRDAPEEGMPAGDAAELPGDGGMPSWARDGEQWKQQDVLMQKVK